MLILCTCVHVPECVYVHHMHVDSMEIKRSIEFFFLIKNFLIQSFLILHSFPCSHSLPSSLVFHFPPPYLPSHSSERVRPPNTVPKSWVPTPPEEDHQGAPVCPMQKQGFFIVYGLAWVMKTKTTKKSQSTVFNVQNSFSYITIS